MKEYKSKYFICIIACLLCITGVIFMFVNDKNKEKNINDITLNYDDDEIVTNNIFNNETKKYFTECGHDVSNVNINYADINETITRQDVYAMIIQYINETDSLRNLCYPVGFSIEEGTETAYYKKLYNGQIITNNDSYRSNVLVNQMKQSSLMNVVTYEFSSGNKMRVFAWDSEETNERYVNFFDDFEYVKENNIQRILQACELGIVNKYLSETSYEVYLHPLENISVYELKEILNKVINMNSRTIPDVITVTSFAGDEFDYDGMSQDNIKVFLRLSNKALIMMADEMNNYMGENEQSYIGLDVNGVSYCLWFNSIKYGALHIPLNYPNEPAYIDVNVSETCNNDVLCGFSLIIPKSYRENFINWAKSGVENEGNYENFQSTCITAYIASIDENTYTIFIS